MSVPLLGLAADIIAANFDRRNLPYKVTLVATYHCNFRCEMCGIWQKDSVDEMTAGELERFFRRWSQFSWVHLTGGELFMRRDLEDLVAAIVESDRSLYLLNFPTTGWFGDRSWDRGIETLRRLRGIEHRHFQVVAGMTLFAKNAPLVDATIEAIRGVIPDFARTDLHLNIGHESEHYFGNAGYLAGGAGPHPVAAAIEAHRASVGTRLHPVRFLEDRYQALVSSYYATHKSPLPCTALASSCFIDPYWQLYPCSIWNESLGSLRDHGFDLEPLWRSKRTKDVRAAIVDEQCPHCWTPCEAYPTILGNLARAVSPARRTAG
jgi:MoaA/NifB/PqqE/SkfB family radical SAM enzyme